MDGEGVDQDMKKAVELYKKAATQGHAWSQNNLGLCYEYGDGMFRYLWSGQYARSPSADGLLDYRKSRDGYIS